MSSQCPCRGCTQSRKDEAARIKAAVEAINPFRMNSLMYDVPAYEAVKVEDVLAAIDGEQA